MAAVDDFPPSQFSSDTNSSPTRYSNDGVIRVMRRPPSQIEAVSTLDSGKGKPWATLNVLSRGNSSRTPVILEGEPIVGTVEVKLQKPDHIEAVTVKVVGAWVTILKGTEYVQDPVRFYTQTVTIWSAAQDKETGSKLNGHYVWPFSITLPAKIKLPAAYANISGDREFPLPPTFTEKKCPSHLRYWFVVKFRRGKLRTDSVLRSPFVYQLQNQPTPTSMLCQSAYRENSIVPGPEVDVQGWEIVGMQQIRGILFQSRAIEVSCAFYLAKPLTYTKGTMIPFQVELHCRDQQTLDLLCLPKSLTITLVRKLTVQFSRKAPNGDPAWKNNVFTGTAGEGAYWPAHDDDPTSATRKLNGEIPLQAKLQPSFSFPYTSVEYMVSLSMAAPGFSVGLDHEDETLFTRKVELATMLGDGPIPRSQRPSPYLRHGW